MDFENQFTKDEFCIDNDFWQDDDEESNWSPQQDEDISWGRFQEP